MKQNNQKNRFLLKILKIHYFCTVKKLTAILSIYILGLMFMPCFDNPNHQDEATANIEYIFDGTHSEICSPFCSDHECHTHITISFVNSTFVSAQYSEVNPTVFTTAIPTPYFAIWQPPKIS
jgi:uncharacterized protein DUF6660